MCCWRLTQKLLRGKFVRNVRLHNLLHTFLLVKNDITDLIKYFIRDVPGLEIYPYLCPNQHGGYHSCTWQSILTCLVGDRYWWGELGKSGGAPPLNFQSYNFSFVQALAMYSWSQQDLGLLSTWCPTPANHSGNINSQRMVENSGDTIWVAE